MSANPGWADRLAATAGRVFTAERVSDIPAAPLGKFLVQSLFVKNATNHAVGLPKDCKSQVAIQVGVAVASATRPFGNPLISPVAPEDAGPVLYVLGEGQRGEVRNRVHAVCAVEGVNMETLPFYIESSFVPPQLDDPGDVEGLRILVGDVRPKLVIVDPLVAFHNGPENDASHMSALARTIRRLQLEFETTVVVVHHARKNVVGGAGDLMRGSSVTWGWSDGMLHVRHLDDHVICVRGRYRDAAATGPLLFDKETVGNDQLYLRLRELAVIGDAVGTDPDTAALKAAILVRLADRGGVPIPVEDLRRGLGRKNATVSAVVRELAVAGDITRIGKKGYVLGVPVPTVSGENGNECREGEDDADA
jgi:hypothetical protein